LLNPWYSGGANNVSLEQAQKNYAEVGVSEAKFKSDVDGLLAGDTHEPSWRPVAEIDRQYVTTPARLAKENPDGPWEWYYWDR